MLTATYSLVALAAEQDNARRLLLRLQQYVQGAWQAVRNLDVVLIETAFGKLLQFDGFCVQRKLETYLLPALRRGTHEADMLLAELDMLGERAGKLLHSLRMQLDEASMLTAGAVREICCAMDAYCDTLLARLNKEEQLLLLVRRLFSVEQWFAIASQFLSDDAGFPGQHAPVTTARRIPSRAELHP